MDRWWTDTAALTTALTLSLTVTAVVVTMIAAETALCQTGEAERSPTIDFTTFTLEELKSVKIVSASKRPERISDIPAAVSVITAEDIRRSGVTNIPDLLRMVPGVQVARISATEWAVNMRGLNEQFSNKLLVLVDGRSVYSHIFSGVYWDLQDMILSDIDRIEVIRGPGAAVWGVNAVNGIINIITKNARATQGYQITALAGSHEESGSVRYGSMFGPAGFYRIWARGFSRGSLFEEDRDIFEDPAHGNWRSGRGGFRFDFDPPDTGDWLTLQGEFFGSRFDVRESDPPLSGGGPTEETETSRSYGGHFLSRWEHRFSDKSNTAWQAYYDYYSKDFDDGNVAAHTVDFDFQHQWLPHDRNEVIWGLNWRWIRDDFDDGEDIEADPSESDQFFYSAFLQDQLTLSPDRLHLTVGSKFEHHSETGTEIQPSVRLLYTPGRTHHFWGGVSRAARVPSRIETDGLISEFVFPSEQTSPTRFRLAGNDDLEAETLWAYELGYGFQPDNRLIFDLTLFYHDYDRLITLRRIDEAGDGLSGDTALFQYDNLGGGESYGLEIESRWQVSPRLRLYGAYTFLRANLQEDVGGGDPISDDRLIRSGNPRNQFSLHGQWDVTKALAFDAALRYVDTLSENDVDDYLGVDMRLGWSVSPLLEFSAVGRNLLEARHAEFSSIEVERVFYVKVDWSF